MAYQTRKRVAAFALVVVTGLLVLGTCTTYFRGVLKKLPTNSDLLFHLAGHSVFVLCLIGLTRLTALVVFAISVGFAIFIECIQYLFVKGRSAQFIDIIAAAIGSCVVFAFRWDHERNERGLRIPLAAWFAADDDYDDEADGHRVSSLVV